MKNFTNETMYEIVLYLQNELKNQNEIFMEVLNPNLEQNYYAGEKVIINNQEFIYRSYKAWCDLAELLFCKILIIDLKINTIVLKFQTLDKIDSFHKDLNDEKKEKYGENSTFFRINKNEEPAFLYAHIQALRNVKIQEKTKILN